VARGLEVSKVRSLTELCVLRVSVESYVAPKGPLQCKRCQRFGPRSVTADTRPPVRRVWRFPPPRWVLYPARTDPVLWLRDKLNCVLQGLYKVERSEGGSCKASTRECPKKRRQRPPCHPESSAGRDFFRADEVGRGMESRRPRGRVVKATTTTPPQTHPVMEAPEQPKVTATRKTPGLRSLSPNLEQALSRLLGSQRKKQPRVSEPLLPNQPSSFPLEDISSIASPPRHVWR
jgi:hypothetical protein